MPPSEPGGAVGPGDGSTVSPARRRRHESAAPAGGPSVRLLRGHGHNMIKTLIQTAGTGKSSESQENIWPDDAALPANRRRLSLPRTRRPGLRRGGTCKVTRRDFESESAPGPSQSPGPANLTGPSRQRVTVTVTVKVTRDRDRHGDRDSPRLRPTMTPARPGRGRTNLN